MKAIKGTLLFGISMAVTSCFDRPEFPLTPEIAYEDIYYTQSTEPGANESLVVTLSFKDGDGDLGLSATDIDEPFHDENYYLALGGNLLEVGKKQLYQDYPSFISVPDNATGTLATVRTRSKQGYDEMAPYIRPYYCTDYSYTEIFVSEEDKRIFEGTDIAIDRIYEDPTNKIPDVYVLLDTFYFHRNPTYANIDVEFYVKENNEFKLYDWQTELCTEPGSVEISYNQRFPVLSDKVGPLSGSLEYAMVSAGFKSTFGIKTMKLKIKIRDRQLNVSNVIETPEITLDKIKR